MIRTPNLVEAVARALKRSTALDDSLSELSRDVRDKLPEEIASQSEKRDRQKFLENLYQTKAQGDAAFERIIQGNELQDAAFLARGALVARTVMRVVLNRPGGGVYGYGTGFLIGDGILITNNHVLPDKETADNALFEALYERDVYGQDVQPWHFEPDRTLFFTSPELDFSIAGIARQDTSGAHQLDSLGWLPLIGGTGKAVEGEWLTIIQHPQGERKQLCVRENRLLKRDTDVLWYSTDTLGGSSGSPVFNNDWLVVALHHSGVPEIKNGIWQKLGGGDFDPARDREDQIDWKANEGIRVSRIVETLRTDPQTAGDARIQALVSTDVRSLSQRLPVLYRAGLGPAFAVTTIGAAPVRTAAVPVTANNPESAKDDPMGERLITVRLAVDDDGSVRVVDQAASSESLTLVEAAKPKGEQVNAPVVPKEDWKDGFDQDFLGKGDHRVNLPVVAGAAQKKLIAPLIPAYGQTPTAEAAKAGVLHYRNYSVVMNHKRRLAFYSAANLDGGVDFPTLTRPDDKWIADERILEEHQLGEGYYRNNHLDRGHLTRREDLEWGTDKVDATRRANGTCTFPNCSPQLDNFNERDTLGSPAKKMWHGLELFVLEQVARHNQFKLQVITGPIFDAFDPEYRGAQIPLDFWKVLVAIDADDRLSAAAFVLSQRGMIDVSKLDIAPKEAAAASPFVGFETHQRPVAEIEKLTGLKFTYGPAKKPLSAVDPFAKELAKPVWKQGRNRAAIPGTREAFGTADSRSLDSPLTTLEQIIL